MPVTKGHEIEFFSHSPAQTRRLGNHLGRLVEPGDVVLLYGDLGAGKTHFTQGIAQGLGITDTVRSPTFTLVNEYEEGRIPLYHVDLYRLDSDAAIATIGLDEYFDAGGVVVVEWPEKGRAWLPAEALHINLRTVGDLRRAFHLHATGPRAEALLHAYKSHTFATRQ